LEEVELAAGVCIIIQRSLLYQINGFNERSIVFDRQVSRKVRNAGKRVYLALGLYVFHLYRWGKEDPENSWEHLVEKKN
jgi:GT2 family glycosyltransferase